MEQQKQAVRLYRDEDWRCHWHATSEHFVWPSWNITCV